MDVAVVTVGDELLAGDTENTNASWLARRLRERGANVRRILVVPDDAAEIAAAVADCSATFDAVLVTGGIGPTHDDVTMDGVARGLGVDMRTSPEAVEYFETHPDYSHADLVEGTMALPAGARMIQNDVGVAPGAVLENVYVLPGVPDEMKAMFGHVKGEFHGIPEKTMELHTPKPESALIEAIEEVSERFDVDVGSYPGEEVTIKLHSTDEETVEAATAWLEKRIR